MQTYETFATVEGEGHVRVSGVPFAPGTQVEVTISPRRRTAADFAAAWQELCRNLRSQPASQVTDAEIAQEVAAFRASR